MRMRWFAVLATAILLTACGKSDETPIPATPADGPGAASEQSASAGDENLVTGPRGAAETLPPIAEANKPAESASDTKPAQPQKELTTQDEKTDMPKPGQTNNFMSEGQKSEGQKTGDSKDASAAPAAVAQADTKADASSAPAAAAAGDSAKAKTISHDEAIALMKKDNCAACHAVDKKLVGPSYKDVAAKYKGDPSAEAYLLEKVKKGGSGVWGPVPMPPNTGSSDADIKALVDWILAGAA